MSDFQVVFVDNAKAMTDCVKQLKKYTLFSFDLEFDRNRHRYGFNLCLMQIMAGDTCFLIDPLPEDIDMSEILQLLESPEIQKVVFSANEDLELLHRLGCHPVNLYDTGIAMRILDMRQSALDVVLDEFLDVSITKTSQMSNWFTRPLSQEQIDYAALDVVHLEALMKALDIRLDKLGRREWAEQENQALESKDYSQSDDALLWKEKDMHKMNQVQFHVFCCLLQYREMHAEALDIPPGRLLHGDYIKEVLMENGLRYWEKNRRTHKSFRSLERKREVIELIKKSEAEALSHGLQKSKRAKSRMSQEDYRAHSEARALKEDFIDNVVKPLKEQLAKRIGENTTAFVLSNRLAGDMYSDPGLVLPPYRIELLLETARSMGVIERVEPVFSKG